MPRGYGYASSPSPSLIRQNLPKCHNPPLLPEYGSVPACHLAHIPPTSRLHPAKCLHPATATPQLEVPHSGCHIRDAIVGIPYAGCRIRDLVSRCRVRIPCCLHPTVEGPVAHAAIATAAEGGAIACQVQVARVAMVRSPCEGCHARAHSSIHTLYSHLPVTRGAIGFASIRACDLTTFACQIRVEGAGAGAFVGRGLGWG